MSAPIKILHIDPDFKVTYFIYREGLSIRTSVPLQTAIALLKKQDFDLILSEPHRKALLKNEHPLLKSESVRTNINIFRECNYGDLREVRTNQYS